MNRCAILRLYQEMNEIQINSLTYDQGIEVLPDLISLLQDVVNGGASVGFIPPLSPSTAGDYWQGVLADLAASRRLLFVAREGDRVCGSVQLALVAKENGLHRADVEKMVVDSDYRNRGIARALLSALETEAKKCGRTTLVLDTEEGSVAEALYRKCGYTEVGKIPKYALSATGSLISTVVFYKLL
jgi:ribosomal protein S18 acetylase RimI-like enzyme